MKKLIFIIIVLLPGSLQLFAGGSGESRWEEASAVSDLRGFDSVENDSVADVFITVSDDWEVRIDGAESDIALLSIQVGSSVLSIRKRHGAGLQRIRGQVSIYIEMPQVRSLQSSGTGNFKVSGVIEGQELILRSSGTGDIYLQANVEVLKARSSGTGDFVLRAISGETSINSSGTGEVRAELRTDFLEAKSSGLGNMEFEGVAGDVRISISGTGKVRAEKLTANQVEVSISGAGDVYISVLESISADISGVGSVHYYGNPDNIERKISGFGSLVEGD